MSRLVKAVHGYEIFHEEHQDVHFFGTGGSTRWIDQGRAGGKVDQTTFWNWLDDYVIKALTKVTLGNIKDGTTLYISDDIAVSGLEGNKENTVFSVQVVVSQNPKTLTIHAYPDEDKNIDRYGVSQKKGKADILRF